MDCLLLGNCTIDMYAELTDLKDSLTIIRQNALQLLLTSEELDKSNTILGYVVMKP